MLAAGRRPFVRRRDIRRPSRPCVQCRRLASCRPLRTSLCGSGSSSRANKSTSFRLPSTRTHTRTPSTASPSPPRAPSAESHPALGTDPSSCGRCTPAMILSSATSFPCRQVAACTGERTEDDEKKPAAARKRSRTKRLPMCLQNESSLAPHSQAVTALCWPHPLALYSASWDASVRHHDAAANSLGRLPPSMSTRRPL